MHLRELLNISKMQLPASFEKSSLLKLSHSNPLRSVNVSLYTVHTMELRFRK